MATIPPGPNPTIPAEPPRLPPANPAERDALRSMIALHRWGEWIYDGSRLAPGSTSTVRVTGWDEDMLNATLHGVANAWPVPPFYPYLSSQKPANAVTVISAPPPAD